MQVLEAPLVGVLDGVPDGQGVGMQIPVTLPERCQMPKISIAVAEGHGASAQYLVFVRCFLDTQAFLVVGCHEDLCFAAFAQSILRSFQIKYGVKSLGQVIIDMHFSPANDILTRHSNTFRDFNGVVAEVSVTTSTEETC